MAKKKYSLEQKAREIVKTLQNKGFQAFWVGGCVRDQLRGVPVSEYDIATNATPNQIRQIFRRTFPRGEQFGVMAVLWGKDQFEVSTFRAEKNYDGRYPAEVKFVEAKEDVLRRDFTMNGILYDPITKKYYDYVGGKKDIQRKLIRAIGDPFLRFEEDKLRMLRAIRFATTLEFSIEENTWKAICQKAAEIQKISKERIKIELEKILTSNNPLKGVKMLVESKMLPAILPPFQQRPNLSQNYTILENLHSPPPAVGFAALLWGFSPEQAYTMLHDLLKASNRLCEEVQDLLENSPHFLTIPQLPLDQFKRLLRKKNIKTHLRLLQALSPQKAEYCRKKLNEFQHHELFPPKLISGKELIQKGFSPGPLFGKILEELENQQLLGNIHTPQQAWDWLQKNFPSPSEKKI